MQMTVVIFHPRAREKLKSYSKEIKKKIGDLILELQEGKMLSMPHSKPMPSIAKGAYELRVKNDNNIYRVFYYIKIKDKILVFHIFNKKAKRTPNKEINSGKERLKELLEVYNEKD